MYFFGVSFQLEEFARVIEPYTLEEFVEDLTNLQEELEEVGELDGLINILPQLVELSKLAPAFKRIFEEYQKGQLERILDEIAPVLERLDEYLEGLPWWQDITEIVRQVEAFMDAVAGGGSRDRGILFNEFIQNATGLAQRLNLTQDVLESLLSQEILPSDLPLLLDLLEYPNRTADLICYKNISQDASVSSESTLVESLTVLCSYDINDIVAAIGKELNVTAFLRELQSLVEDNRNPSNQTTDWQEFFSQAIDLVEVLRTAQNTSVFELARDLLENLDNLDLYELNPWLDFLLDGSMGGLLGNGTLGGNR
ncbi:hypothetical protein BSL78_14671 [Apostichopus japonicus]|uniref:Uncharacterized protein n=1 Tax=Stichopus japonicus TaxID=307972 RepID=A0A2G8KKH7_STIJA|nr:hypothetical protein BSL78_14671 [Apostichopus japonicus]